MRTLAGGQADGIARWAWLDPPARVHDAISQVRELGDDADADGQREVGDVLTMLTRLASSVGTQMDSLGLANPIELRFDPAELRDSRGRWTRFGETGSAADVMMKNREGFSVSVKTGGQPVSGYMVAQTDHTHVYPESILDDHHKLTRAIDDMLVSEKAAFRGKGDVYLGGWVHDGKLWLEPSDNIASRDQAVHEGTRRNQIAIWDVDNGEEIQTGGSGGGRITEHANPQGHHWPGPAGLRGDGRGGAAGDSWRAGPGSPGGAGTGMTSTIMEQLDLSADTSGLLAQIMELAVGNEAWRKERRDAHGQWTRGSAATAVAKRTALATGRPSAGMQRVSARRAVQNRQAAQTAVAERIAEDKARKALDDAKAEVERVTRELQQQASTEETKKHRVKLAVHAVLIAAGALLAAVLAHYDVSPVLASLTAAMPLLATELTDWRKKLLWSPGSRSSRCFPRCLQTAAWGRKKPTTWLSMQSNTRNPQADGAAHSDRAS